MEFSHVPVLFRETVESLSVRPDGVYADCTAGGGGHSAAIAEKLTTGRLIAIDRDPDAIETLMARFADNPAVTVVHDTFQNVGLIRAAYAPEGFDGVLADLGVSSHQLDTPERGFSFHTDGALDMRMSQTGKSAYDVVNTYDEGELRRILYEYGEEKCAGSGKLSAKSGCGGGSESGRGKEKRDERGERTGFARGRRGEQRDTEQAPHGRYDDCRAGRDDQGHETSCRKI